MLVLSSSSVWLFVEQIEPNLREDEIFERPSGDYFGLEEIHFSK